MAHPGSQGEDVKSVLKALILVPASVLKQWQEELAEKIGLVVPRYDGKQFLDLDDQPVDQPAAAVAGF